MSSHTKSSMITMTGAVAMLLTVVIRHTSDSPATTPWTEWYLPIAGFILIGIGMYLSVRASREPKA